MYIFKLLWNTLLFYSSIFIDNSCSDFAMFLVFLICIVSRICYTALLFCFFAVTNFVVVFSYYLFMLGLERFL